MQDFLECAINFCHINTEFCIPIQHPLFFWGGFWALLSQIWSKIAEILIRSSSLANKNIV